MTISTPNSNKKNDIIIKEMIALSNLWKRPLCCQDPNNTFEEYIRLNISNPMNAVRVLDTCKCCERHQKNRPHKLKKWKEFPGSPYNFNNYYCSCQCRQLSRFICRAFID